MAASMDSSPPNNRRDNLSLFSSSCGIPPGKLRVPFVMKKSIQTWPCRKWNVSELVEILGTRKLKFRIGPRNIPTGSVLWEGMCSYEVAHLGDFHEWCTASPGECPAHNPLRRYSRDEYWCYADYKYMKDLFPDQTDILEAVRWSSFGLDSYSGEQSTLWIGTAGAHTVCHQDTYGFNLVAQIQGRKKWYLFPPVQGGYLYPTRIPYEESSIFSEVSITNPDMRRHPKYRHATPYVVTLDPGDVLYVPRQWWHFVECLETSVSINCWVEVPADDYSRVQESIVRFLMCRILDKPEQCGAAPKWLNPTETITSHETNLLYLGKSLDVIEHLPRCRGASTEIRRGTQEQVSLPAQSLSTESTPHRDDGHLTTIKTYAEPNRDPSSVGHTKFVGVEDVMGSSSILKGQSVQETDVDKSVPVKEFGDGSSQCPVCGTRQPGKETEDCDVATNSSIGVREKSVAALHDCAVGIDQYITDSKKLCTGLKRVSEFEIQPLCPIGMETLINRRTTNSQTVEEMEVDDDDEHTLEEVLVQCVTDPRVISMVTELLLERVGSRPR